MWSLEWNKIAQKKDAEEGTECGVFFLILNSDQFNEWTMPTHLNDRSAKPNLPRTNSGERTFTSPCGEVGAGEIFTLP